LANAVASCNAFETRFFIAAYPGQTPLPTSYEVAHSSWLTPDRAMQMFSRGELPMIFPTFAALRTLADLTPSERYSVSSMSVDRG
jgi:hypothetical protein